jgi:hypothetical protein
MNSVNGLRSRKVTGKWRTNQGKKYNADECIAWEIDDLACQEGGVTTKSEYDSASTYRDIKTYLFPIGNAQVIF